VVTKKPTKRKTGAAMPREIALVFEAPDDDAAKQVAADALLERESPWGELIALQMNQKGKTKRVKELIAKHLDLFCGPIFNVAQKKTVVFEKGFLVEVEPERRLVPRPEWEAAASALHWATVRMARLSCLTTPNWWITEWSKRAPLHSLRHVDFSNYLQIDRASSTSPWRVFRADKTKFLIAMFVAFAKGLPAAEQARIEFGPKVKAVHRALVEEALAKAGIRR
jgi:hypothetical protein